MPCSAANSTSGSQRLEHLRRVTVGLLHSTAPREGQQHLGENFGPPRRDRRNKGESGLPQLDCFQRRGAGHFGRGAVGPVDRFGVADESSPNELFGNLTGTRAVFSKGEANTAMKISANGGRHFFIENFPEEVMTEGELVVVVFDQSGQRRITGSGMAVLAAVAMPALGQATTSVYVRTTNQPISNAAFATTKAAPTAHCCTAQNRHPVARRSVIPSPYGRPLVAPTGLTPRSLRYPDRRTSVNTHHSRLSTDIPYLTYRKAIMSIKRQFAVGVLGVAVTCAIALPIPSSAKAKIAKATPTNSSRFFIRRGAVDRRICYTSSSRRRRRIGPLSSIAVAKRCGLTRSKVLRQLVRFSGSPRGANTWPRFGLEAAEQVLRLPKVLNDAKNAAMFIFRNGPLDMPAAVKVGGPLSIVGGALGLVDDVAKYKSHEISGGMLNPH